MPKIDGGNVVFANKIATLTYTGVSGSGKVDDNDTSIYMGQAQSPVEISVDSTAVLSTAEDWDVNIMTCDTEDGTYKLLRGAEQNFEAGAVVSYFVNCGSIWWKIYVDLNTGARLDATIKVTRRE